MSGLRSLFVLLLCVAAAGCDVSPKLLNPDQPRDLGAPWVNKTEMDMGVSSESTDADMNRVFTVQKDELGSLLGSIAAEYETPIAVKPKKILNWNLTVEVKGKNLDEVLKDVASKCHLTLGKSAKGQALLTYDRDSAGEEFVIDPQAEDTED
ncbi:MAG TPA: hypothetical protein VHB77_22045 [Planctomycetaceae bacterium]|nr:hypothetical protein [Planctomycetaceae bacterium]